MLVFPLAISFNIEVTRIYVILSMKDAVQINRIIEAYASSYLTREKQQFMNQF